MKKLILLVTLLNIFAITQANADIMRPSIILSTKNVIELVEEPTVPRPSCSSMLEEDIKVCEEIYTNNPHLLERCKVRARDRYIFCSILEEEEEENAKKEKSSS